MLIPRMLCIYLLMFFLGGSSGSDHGRILKVSSVSRPPMILPSLDRHRAPVRRGAHCHRRKTKSGGLRPSSRLRHSETRRDALSAPQETPPPLRSAGDILARIPRACGAHVSGSRTRARSAHSIGNPELGALAKLPRALDPQAPTATLQDPSPRLAP